MGYTATPEVCWNSNMLCLSMCLSSSCSKFLSGLMYQLRVRTAGASYLQYFEQFRGVRVFFLLCELTELSSGTLL